MGIWDANSTSPNPTDDDEDNHHVSSSEHGSQNPKSVVLRFFQQEGLGRRRPTETPPRLNSQLRVYCAAFFKTLGP